MKRNDQVFQLSLTEIAFIVVFLLLLLLGAMVHQSERKPSLVDDVNKITDANAAKAAAQRPNAQRSEVSPRSGSADPSELISQLVNREKLEAEEAALRQRVDALDRTVSALAQVKNGLDHEEHGGATRTQPVSHDVAIGLVLTDAVRRHLAQLADTASAAPLGALTPEQIVVEAQSALALKSALRRELTTTTTGTLDAASSTRHRLRAAVREGGKESELARELVAALAKSESNDSHFGAPAAGEIKDLRGQVAFLNSRLGAKGGRDYPPCWAEEGTGKLQYLFAIDIHDNGLVMRAAWPAARAAEAKHLPGLDALVLGSPIVVSQFTTAMQGIDHASRLKNCRHYVLLRNHVKDLDVFNTYRYAVENYFYKLEVRS